MLTSKTLNIVKDNDLVYIQFPKLQKIDFIRHTFSTRHGGVSRGDAASMNLSFNKDSDPQNVKILRFCAVRWVLTPRI